MFVVPTCLLESPGSVGRGVRMKNSDVKERVLPPRPESRGTDVRSCFIRSRRAPGSEDFAREWLQQWLNGHVVAHFRQQLANDVAQFVVPDRWEATKCTNHCMVGGEIMAANAR